jgi:hypothetical protein
MHGKVRPLVSPRLAPVTIARGAVDLFNHPPSRSLRPVTGCMQNNQQRR